jgi:O-methyltransferase involved in polyketide biosynthesis
MEHNLHVHETAFITSTYRSTHPDLSKDPFAGLWNTPATDKWVAEHVVAVSEHEPHLHCLRNRYFFEQLQRLFTEQQISVLVNFGSGFSMYPFSLPENLRHIELDFPNILAYKRQHVETWMKNGVLPKRHIHYIGADFMAADTHWVDELLSVKGQAKSFILIEGVLFFLDTRDTHSLFAIFDSIQQSGEYIGSVSFQEKMEGTAVFGRLLGFCTHRLNYPHGFNYQVVPDSFYHGLSAYDCVDHQDGTSLNQQFSPDYPLPEHPGFLNENMYLLRKK